jgi:hypothetical protein
VNAVMNLWVLAPRNWLVNTSVIRYCSRDESVRSRSVRSKWRSDQSVGGVADKRILPMLTMLFASGCTL